MFVQVIDGEVQDRQAARRLWERWHDELASSAAGWLGSTGGLTDDGRLIGVVRFASADEARRNSERPEQGAWWQEMAKVFSGPVTFHDCEDVMLLAGGGSDGAGFVQVIDARVVDGQALRTLLDQWSSGFGRPEIIGALMAFHDDGERLTEVVYFTSEEEARRGEAAASAAPRREMERWRSAVGELRYGDLRDPWLASA